MVFRWDDMNIIHVADLSNVLHVYLGKCILKAHKTSKPDCPRKVR